MRASRVTGNFNSPALIRDPESEPMNIGEVSSTGPTDNWPAVPFIITLEFRAEVL
jgi:hypothetical protein